VRFCGHGEALNLEKIGANLLGFENSIKSLSGSIYEVILWPKLSTECGR